MLVKSDSLRPLLACGCLVSRVLAASPGAAAYAAATADADADSGGWSCRSAGPVRRGSVHGHALFSLDQIYACAAALDPLLLAKVPALSLSLSLSLSLCSAFSVSALTRSPPFSPLSLLSLSWMTHFFATSPLTPSLFFVSI